MAAARVRTRVQKYAMMTMMFSAKVSTMTAAMVAFLQRSRMENCALKAKSDNKLEMTDQIRRFGFRNGFKSTAKPFLRKFRFAARQTKGIVLGSTECMVESEVLGL